MQPPIFFEKKMDERMNEVRELCFVLTVLDLREGEGVNENERRVSVSCTVFLATWRSHDWGSFI